MPTLLILITVALATSSAGAGQPVRIATSIHPLASIIREVAGDRVDLTTIVPGGKDPHHFELMPKVAKAIFEADLVVLVGDHFDSWVVEGLIEGQGPQVYEFCIAFEDSLIPIGEQFNPHFWLDPFYAKAMGMIVNVVLGTIDEPNADFYAMRTLAFCAGVDSLHEATRRRLEESGVEGFAALHPAWSYFARRYGLQEVATIEISHEQEPSARHVTHVISEMKKHDVRLIFAEQFSNPDLAEVVASATGAKIVFLDPIGDADTPERDSYFDLIDHNVSLIEQATHGSHRE
jgi:zinc transport system substrate-binding protein